MSFNLARDLAILKCKCSHLSAQLASWQVADAEEAVLCGWSAQCQFEEDNHVKQTKLQLTCWTGKLLAATMAVVALPVDNVMQSAIFSRSIEFGSQFHWAVLHTAHCFGHSLHHCICTATQHLKGAFKKSCPTIFEHRRMSTITTASRGFRQENFELIGSEGLKKRSKLDPWGHKTHLRGQNRSVLLTSGGFKTQLEGQQTSNKTHFEWHQKGFKGFDIHLVGHRSASLTSRNAVEESRALLLHADSKPHFSLTPSWANGAKMRWTLAPHDTLFGNVLLQTLALVCVTHVSTAPLAPWWLCFDSQRGSLAYSTNPHIQKPANFLEPKRRTSQFLVHQMFRMTMVWFHPWFKPRMEVVSRVLDQELMCALMERIQDLKRNTKWNGNDEFPRRVLSRCCAFLRACGNKSISPWQNMRTV